MKGILKRTLSLVLVATIVISTVACEKETKEEQVNREQLTRGMWVSMLAQCFGLDEYKGEKSYYTDVQPENKIYPYVQACYEWGLLSTGTEKFKPDDVATVGFVVSTAVLASELDYEQYIEGDNINDALIKCAYNNGFYNVQPGDEKLNNEVTIGEAVYIANLAVGTYMNADKEEVMEVEYADNVSNYTEHKDEIKILSDSSAVIPEDKAIGLAEGDIFYIEATIEDPSGAAYKVVSKVDNGDGTYTVTTETPTFEEVFENIDLYTMPEITADNIFPVEGVTMTVIHDDTENADSSLYIKKDKIDDLTSTDSSTNSMAKASAEASTKFGFEFDFKDKKSKLTKNVSLDPSLELFNHTVKGEIDKDSDTEEKTEETTTGGHSNTQNSESNSADASKFTELMEQTNVTDSARQAADAKKYMDTLVNQYTTGSIDKEYFKDKVKELSERYNPNDTLSVSGPKGKYKAGYEITGSVEVKLAVEAEVVVEWFKLKKFSATGDVNVKGEIKLEGKLETELQIAKIVIPVGGVFAIEGSLKLYATINGEVGVTLELDSKIKMSANKGGNFKKSSEASADLSLSATAKIEAGFKVVLAVSALGFDIVDVQFLAGGLAEAEITGAVETKVVPLVDGDNEYDNGMAVGIIATLDSKVGLYAPILKLKVGGEGTLLKKLGISATFTLSGKEDAAFKYEIDPEPISYQLYYDEIEFDKEEELESEESTTVQDETVLNESVDYTKGIIFDEQIIRMQKGQEEALNIKLPMGYELADVEWSSSDSEIVSITNGIVKVEDEGYAYIFAKTKDGKYEGKCLIVVE